MSSLANLPASTDINSQESQSNTDALACLPVPIARLERHMKYRNQASGEATLKIRITNDTVAGPISPVCRTPEITFCQLLIAAGVLSEASILAAMEESYAGLPLIRTIARKFKIPRRTCVSICLLVEKLRSGTMTFNESVLATQHMCEFRSSLAEALQFVTSMAQQSIISFLQVVGLVSDDDLYAVTDNQWIEPRRLAAMLVAKGMIEIDVLRNATRLRYWLKTGALDLETANGLLLTCMRQSMDVEYCLRQELRAA